MTLYEENLIRLKRVAQKRGLVFNPDQARVEKVVGLMTENFKMVGEYVCPCKQRNKPPVKGKDILCPCTDMMDEIARDGHCYCCLFFTPEAASLSNDTQKKSCCGNEINGVDG